MSHADPYFVVRDEITKSLGIADHQYSVWRKLVTCQGATRQNSEALNQATTDLRTTLRSIEWDLEDIQETVSIVERNPGKFSLSRQELSTRQNFVDHTRTRLAELKKSLANPDNASASLVTTGSSVSVRGNAAVYSSGDPDGAISQAQSQQQMLLSQQDNRLEDIGGRITVLKDMSRAIGGELDDQAQLLDDIGTEMGRTENRLDANMKRLARVLHMSSDKRQWCVIGVLLLIILIVIVLLVML